MFSKSRVECGVGFIYIYHFFHTYLLMLIEGLIYKSISYFFRFPVQLLSPVPGLSFLDISWNNLNFLDERTMFRLESVSRVILTGNPWACDKCHILPMLKQANTSSWAGGVQCVLPYRLQGRTLASLSSDELSLCGSGLDFKEEGFAGLALTHRTQLGLIAAGSAAAFLFVTMVAAVVGLVYSRRNGGCYYGGVEEKRQGGDEKMCNGERKVSIATIDEISKDGELEALAPTEDQQLTSS